MINRTMMIMLYNYLHIMPFFLIFHLFTFGSLIPFVSISTAHLPLCPFVTIISHHTLGPKYRPFFCNRKYVQYLPAFFDVFMVALISTSCPLCALMTGYRSYKDNDSS